MTDHGRPWLPPDSNSGIVPAWRDVVERLLAFNPVQIISYSRLALAGFALVAVCLDPTQPQRYPDITYAVLAVYVAYALGLAIASRFTWVDVKGPLIRHIVDIGIFALLMYLTDGPTSPFFVFFTFAIVSGALQWGGKGAVATAAALIAFFLAISLRDYLATDEIGISRVVMRTAYLLVASLMLGYFGAYRQRSRDRLARLAAWPPVDTGPADEPPLAASLRHATLILQARQIVVVWESLADPGWCISYWDGQRYDANRPIAAAASGLVAGELGDITFMAPDPSARIAIVDGGIVQTQMPLLAADLLRSFDIQWFASAPFGGSYFRGRIFILGPRTLTVELLSLAEIVAARIGLEFEHFGMRVELGTAAAARERLRLSRDVHDGVLQDFSAASLELKSILDRAPKQVRQPIEAMLKVFAAQQRRIREFVTAMNPKPDSSERVAVGVALRPLLDELAEKWRCGVDLKVCPETASLPAKRLRQIRFVLAEAVANAVLHGRASQVSIAIEMGSSLGIEVRDNGLSATPQAGAHDDHQPAPFSIVQRIEELGGTARLTVAAGGGALAIELPAG